MSSTTVPSAVASPTPSVVSVGRVRIVLVAGTLALGAVAVIGVLLWHPGPPRDVFTYASLAPVRNTIWTAALIDAVGYALATVALALAVSLLASGRGAAWANVGAVLTSTGGIVFALGAFAYGVLGWYATSLPPATGTGFTASIKSAPGHMAGPEAAGFVLLNLGVLLLAVALWRAGSVPRPFLIALVVFTIGQFAGLPNRALDVEQSIVMAAYAAVGWYLIRAAGRRS